MMRYIVLLPLLIATLLFSMPEIFAEDGNLPRSITHEINSEVRSEALNEVMDHLEEFNCQDLHSQACKLTKNANNGLALLGIFIIVSPILVLLKKTFA